METERRGELTEARADMMVRIVNEGGEGRYTNVTMGSKRDSKGFMIEIFVPKRSRAALTISGKYLEAPPCE
jgi:hypothetical protein